MPEQFTHRAICQLHERGQVIRDHFVSQLLSSNPLGDPYVRPLWVYTPPGYDAGPRRRYPAVYVIQGYTGTIAMWRNRSPFRQPFPELDYTAAASGDSIAVRIYQQANAAAGQSFEVDNLSLITGSTDTIPPTVPAGVAALSAGLRPARLSH